LYCVRGRGSSASSRDILSLYSGKGQQQKIKERLARVLVLGDSHSKLFFSGVPITGHEEEGSASRRGGDGGGQSADDPLCATSNYFVCVVPGASMYGLKNLNSASNATRTFLDCLRRAGRVDAVLVTLGEVDIRYLAHHRGLSRGVTILDQVRESTSSLSFFITEVLVRQEGFQRDQVVVMSVPMKCPHGDRDGRLLVKRDTSYSTIRFNSALEDLCADIGCAFASSTDDVFDYSSSEVRQFFWTNPLDMHCSSQRMYFFWHRAVQRATKFPWCKKALF
jgi:hypothetical protein